MAVLDRMENLFNRCAWHTDGPDPDDFEGRHFLRKSVKSFRSRRSFTDERLNTLDPHQAIIQISQGRVQNRFPC